MRDPRNDPRPGDVVQVRPWKTVYTRTVVEPDDRIVTRGEGLVVYTSPEERPGGGRTIMSLDQWRADAERPLEVSEEEAEGFLRFDAALEVLERATRLCRAEGHHCLSCCSEEEADEYERRARAGEDAEVEDG
jgi:hypothetical protein